MRIFGFDLSLKRAPLAPVSNRGWYPLIVREPYTGAWQRNDEWTVDSVLGFPGIYACITLIANDIAKLRPRLVELRNNIWVEAQSNAFSPLLRRPNHYQNHIQFKQWWMASKLAHGNTYALIRRDGRGVPDALYILDPTRVMPMVSPDGSVFYSLQSESLAGVSEAIMVPASEIIHDRINCLFHPLVGVSPIFAAGNAANIGLRIQSNASGFFGNGSQPSGILTAPGAISDDTAARLKEQWTSNYGGANAGKIAVVGDNLKFEQMRMSAVDSQLIEQLKWTAEIACAVFHVPPYKIGVGQLPSYQNVQSLQQDYYNTCLQSLIEEFEQCMDDALGIGYGVKTSEGRELGVELDLRGLLRMDTLTQVDVITKKIAGSVCTINEGRAEMDLPPVPGGDSVWMQQQNYSLQALQERDASADPFGTNKPAPPAAAPAEPDADPDEELDEESRAFVAQFTKSLTTLIESAA